MCTVLEKHVEINVRQGQVTVEALSGDPEDLDSDTFVFLNGNPIRSRIPYLISSGAELQIGSDTPVLKLNFEEKTNVNPINEAILKSMVSGFSTEGQDAFNETWEP